MIGIFYLQLGTNQFARRIDKLGSVTNNMIFLRRAVALQSLAVDDAISPWISRTFGKYTCKLDVCRIVGFCFPN